MSIFASAPEQRNVGDYIDVTRWNAGVYTKLNEIDALFNYTTGHRHDGADKGRQIALVNISGHTKAVHDALNINASTVDGFNASGILVQDYTQDVGEQAGIGDAGINVISYTADPAFTAKYTIIAIIDFYSQGDTFSFVVTGNTIPIGQTVYKSCLDRIPIVVTGQSTIDHLTTIRIFVKRVVGSTYTGTKYTASLTVFRSPT